MPALGSPPRRLQQTNDPSRLPLIAQALATERDPTVRAALEIAQARLELQSADPAARRHAVELLGRSDDAAFRPVLAALMQQRDGAYAEPDAGVREAAADALRRIDRRLATVEWAGNLFYGLSLGSVLLLAALGLAITFGLMGVINMAHGELLMIGAYVTYVVQTLFRAWLPGWLDWYVAAALPLAFLVTALVGMALERTVIRWLYGRPLETLLATWGISLMLMQGVRSLFGAQNVEVGNPGWMSGGVTVLGGLVLSYNRLVIIGFALAVVALVWVLLNHTRLGLFVRAITQNRRMADCTGVPTGRVDMLAFGLGSASPGWPAWRCRSWAMWARTWGAATSSIRSWWWCWAAWASWPAPSSPRWAWAASTNSWNPMRERSWPRSPSWRLSCCLCRSGRKACSPRAAGASNEARRAGSGPGVAPAAVFPAPGRRWPSSPRCWRCCRC